jgi:hypothetical protein
MVIIMVIIMVIVIVIIMMIATCMIMAVMGHFACMPV